MGLVLAVDPGRTTGWALYRDALLIEFGKVPGARARLGALPVADRVVIERPVIRRNHPRPDDILKLALLAGEIAGHFDGDYVQFVTPEGWKGQLPKDVCWTRARGKLNRDELALLLPAVQRREKKLDHNIADAIALGLWALGRFGK
jgi:hypothetical protein